MITYRCNCGFTVEIKTAQDGQALIHQHFLDNLATHTIGVLMGGVHAHISNQPKPSWIQRLMGYYWLNK